MSGRAGPAALTALFALLAPSATGCATVMLSSYAEGSSLPVDTELVAVTARLASCARTVYAVDLVDRVEDGERRRRIYWAPDDAELTPEVRRLAGEDNRWWLVPGSGWSCQSWARLEPATEVTIVSPGPRAAEAGTLVLFRDRPELQDGARVLALGPYLTASVPRSRWRRLAWAALPLTLALDVLTSPVQLVLLISILTYDGPWP